MPATGHGLFLWNSANLDVLIGGFMAKKTAFISFDYDNDEFLRTALVGQAEHPNSPFEIIDRSVRAPLLGDWKAKVRERIRRADLVIVLCGLNTHTASGVAIELQFAKDLGKPYFLLKGYKDKNCTWPSNAESHDKMYEWTWPNLTALIGGAR